MKDQNYEDTLSIIEAGKFLPTDALEFIRGNISEIQSVWSKRQIYRTETEMNISVLNDIKFPTSASKYWQCVRELSSMYESLVTLSFEFRRNDNEIGRLKKQLSKVDYNDEYASFNFIDLQIELETCQFKKLNMEATGKDRAREIKMWSNKMKDLDNGSFNTEDVNEHQLISYAMRFDRQRVNLTEHSSVSERNNLIGQHETAMKALKVKHKTVAIEGAKDGEPKFKLVF